MANNQAQNKITFTASVSSVRTLVDGGINVVFSLDENSIMQVAALLQCKKDMIPLKVEVMADVESEAE
jgi:hypothetical protein